MHVTFPIGIPNIHVTFPTGILNIHLTLQHSPLGHRIILKALDCA
jgi:hypothetical protein